MHCCINGEGKQRQAVEHKNFPSSEYSSPKSPAEPVWGRRQSVATDGGRLECIDNTESLLAGEDWSVLTMLTIVSPYWQEKIGVCYNSE